MRITLLPSVAGPDAATAQVLSSTLVNGDVAVDAGCLSQALPVADLLRVKHVFLTHSHIDHTASLGPFVDTAYTGTDDCVNVYANRATLDAVRRDLFNDRLWPDFVSLSLRQPPFLRLHELEPGGAVRVGDLRVTAVPVHHVVPTQGYLLEEKGVSVLLSGDTAPTDELWRVGRKKRNLKAVFLEMTFPEPYAWLAEVAKHLTPRQFVAEAAKLDRPDVRFIAVHVHIRHRPQVVAEFEAVKGPNMELGVFGRPYDF